MKLCKDCKHVAMPSSPYMNIGMGNGYKEPMCGHPSAPRNLVDGALARTCASCRTGATDDYCGREGRMFEDGPAPRPFFIVETSAPPRRTFWQRLFG